MPKSEQDAAIKRVASLLQIEPLLNRKPGQLSGGQRQRVAMGRALVRDPKLFLFDEPLSNLDAKLRVDMRTEIKKLHLRVGKTTIYVTHDQIEAMTLASRIAVMHQGSIQQFDEPQVVYDRPANMFVAGFMGSPSMNFIAGRLRHGRETMLAIKAVAAGTLASPSRRPRRWPNPRRTCFINGPKAQTRRRSQSSVRCLLRRAQLGGDLDRRPHREYAGQASRRRRRRHPPPAVQLKGPEIAGGTPPA